MCFHILIVCEGKSRDFRPPRNFQKHLLKVLLRSVQNAAKRKLLQGMGTTWTELGAAFALRLCMWKLATDPEKLASNNPKTFCLFSYCLQMKSVRAWPLPELHIWHNCKCLMPRFNDYIFTQASVRSCSKRCMVPHPCCSKRAVLLHVKAQNWVLGV